MAFAIFIDGDLLSNTTGGGGGGGGGGTWGSITGTLSAQTDLQTALNGKVNTINPSSSGTFGHTGSSGADPTFTVVDNGRFRVTNNSTGRPPGWQTAVIKTRFDSTNTNQVGLQVDIEHVSGTGGTTNRFSPLQSLLGGLHKGSFYIDVTPTETWSSGGAVNGKVEIGFSGNRSGSFGIDTASNRRYFFSANSTNEFGIVIPDGTNYNITMPSTQGGAGQVLQNNGSGTLSWATPSSGGGSNITGTYVKEVYNNINLGSSGFSGYPTFGISSTGRAFVCHNDGSNFLIYSASSVNGTYTQLASYTNGAFTGGVLFDIGPSGDGFVYYRSASTANWTRWNGSSLVPVTTPASSATVNSGRGLGYNGTFFYVAYGSAGQEVIRYSTDNGDTWQSGNSAWHHTSGQQMNGMAIAVGVAGGNFIIITQLTSSPASSKSAYLSNFAGSPNTFTFPTKIHTPLAYDSNGTIMAVYFNSGVLAVTSDGGTWTYLAVGTNSGAGTLSPVLLKIRSTDIILFAPNGKVYSVSHNLSAVNWIRLWTTLVTGGSSSTPCQSTWGTVVGDELFYSVLGTSSTGMNNCSIEKLTFS